MGTFVLCSGMSATPEKTAAEKLAEAVRHKAETDKSKGGGAPGRGSHERGAAVSTTQNTRPSVSKRSGSFKGR